ncbi:hypothetical protein ABTE26_19875, partial [Acinetobacter baumannii]
LIYYFIYHRKLLVNDHLPTEFEKHIPKISIWKYILCFFLPWLRDKTTVVRFPGEPKLAALENRVLNYNYNMTASCSLTVNFCKAFHALHS